MHCALQRIHSNCLKDAEGGNSCFSQESLEQRNINASLKDCEVPYIVWSNSNYRNYWRCWLLKMFKLSVSSLKADRPKVLKGSFANRNSVKSLTTRSFSGLNFQLQSPNKGLPNKEYKSVKGNSRKKLRKKGKLNKKISSETGLNELEYAHTHVSSTSITDADVGRGRRVGPLPCATTPPVSMTDHKFTGNYVTQSFGSENHLCKSENGLRTNYPEFSILNGEIQDTNCKSVSCYEEPCSSVFSETSNSVLLDSSSLGSSSDRSFNADEESTTSDISRSLDCISRNGGSSFVSISSDVVGPNSRAGRHLEVWEKREKPVKRVPKNSSAYRVGSASNLHGCFGKENNHSVWQKVQRNDAESTKVNSVCSSLLKKNRHFDSNALSNSEDKSRTKLEVSQKLKNKSNPRSKGEYEYYNRTQTNGQKVLDTVSTSHSKIGYPRIGFQTKKVESLTFKPVRSSQVSLSDEKPLENVYTDVSNLNDQNPENEASFLSGSCNSLDPSELPEDLSAVHEEVCYSKKWIPVGVKDSPLTSDLSTTKIDELGYEGWSFQITAEEGFSSESINSRVRSTEQSAETVSGSDSWDCSNNHTAAERVIPTTENVNIYTCRNDSSEVVRAVNDACRAQLASEAIQMTTGYPIAEFERLLLSASPVVCSSYDIVSCQSCSRDWVSNSSLCEHETPKISIGSLWQWYEKHGTYGLEVKAEDNERSMRLGADCAEFCAYFVPFLSAVQLFRKSNSDGIHNTDIVEASEMYITSEGTEVNESGCVTPETPQCSVCIEDSDLELIFEFFESEQPQKRRPLFEMIKQLVKGDGPPKCRVDGDPTILDSVDLHDLHPKSWYSVAWYPIYRIPDGNFRAAFLTYHSLGHLIRNGSTFNSFCANPCIVSPVVGLQSYNAQDECWFQPRHSTNSLTAEVSNLNPEGILKERLSTLELTAALMARAVVTKGSQTRINRQPDYEFFVSRQRW